MLLFCGVYNVSRCNILDRCSIKEGRSEADTPVRLPSFYTSREVCSVTSKGTEELRMCTVILEPPLKRM